MAVRERSGPRRETGGRWKGSLRLAWAAETSVKIMAWHEEEGTHRPRYLFKLKLTQNVKRAIQAVDWPE